ncbi:Ig-like domain-containing protein [Neobacillus sp. LXY-1]|uniref:Ig-like domain-containing protein n=1 Tax=Neobacillus sp. LXY-1 TaxID=3379133 RepID=UPI003EE0CE7C
MFQKTLAIILTVLLILPTVSYAQAPESQQLPTKNLNAKTVDKAPRPSLSTQADYQDPSNYPLIGEGSFVKTLYDSYGGYHMIYFDKVTTSSYGTNYLNAKLRYYSQYSYSKDGIVTVEFYTNQSNTLKPVENTEFDTEGTSATYLNSHLLKSNYTNQPYIYIRLGLSSSTNDSYYSDVTTFKVANPYYTGSTTKADKYAVINNESTSLSKQSTGVFNLKNMNYTFDQNAKPGVYKMDVNIPFNIPNNQDNQIKKSTNFIPEKYMVGQAKSFWVTNLVDNTNSQISAKLAYSGTKANVWVYNNQITTAAATKLGTEFDNKIYSSVTTNFGKESDINNDGKVNILCYDIQDGFNGSGGYVAGYFWAGDLYNTSNSNKSEIFYIDTYPAMGIGATKDVTEAYETLAHEFQHMVNFNQNVLIEKSSTGMDTWLDEGLAMAAEQIYTGKGLSDRIDYYNMSSSIKSGHSLLYWDNYGDTLANYSLSYLFGQYIKKQSGQGDRIFKEILRDPNNNYKAVEDVAKKYIDSNITFGKLMTDFRIALLLKKSTGLYGFKGDTFFNSLKDRIYSGNSASLRGGGSIVTTYSSAVGLTIPKDKGANITYTTLNKDGNDVTPPAVPKVATVTDRATVIKGTTEAYARVTAKVGTTKIGSATADKTGAFSIPIAKQKAGTIITVVAQDKAYNESSAKVLVAAAYTQVNIQLNGVNFTKGYTGGGTTYIHFKALDTFNIPYKYKGNGVFDIQGRTVNGQSINGAMYLRWSTIAPGKITYEKITGGYNFIYTK